jgi:hypothetical protein
MMRKTDRGPKDYISWLPPKPATVWRWLEPQPELVKRVCAAAAMAVSAICGLLAGGLGANVVDIILLDRSTFERIQIESGLTTVLIGIGLKLYGIARSRPPLSKART